MMYFLFCSLDGLVGMQISIEMYITMFPYIC